MSGNPVPRFTFITLGVADMRVSIAFYESLGFARKFRATGEAVAFFDTGATASGCSRGMNWQRTRRCRQAHIRRAFAA